MVEVIRPCSCTSLATHVAQTLYFAPELVHLADRILSGLRAAGVHTFNGLHLRIERDAQDWAAIMGGEEVRTRF